jgi:hypothetical protein
LFISTLYISFLFDHGVWYFVDKLGCNFGHRIHSAVHPNIPRESSANAMTTDHLRKVVEVSDLPGNSSVTFPDVPRPTPAAGCMPMCSTGQTIIWGHATALP